MKGRYIAFFLAISLLTSCGRQKLRSDIEEFITSFSLEGAISAYLEGGYTSVQTEKTGNVDKKEEIFFEFNVKDAAHPQYKKTTKNYAFSSLVSTIVEEIIEEDGKLIFRVTDEKDVVYTLEECHDVIKKFFYKVSMFDDQYHVQGMYYGDLIKHEAPDKQNYITIDQEKDLYIYQYSVDFTYNNLPAHSAQKYTVNRLGMLVDNHFEGEMEGVKKAQDIHVYAK